jgi:hypothetical protein
MLFECGNDDIFEFELFGGFGMLLVDGFREVSSSGPWDGSWTPVRFDVEDLDGVQLKSFGVFRGLNFIEHELDDEIRLNA